MREIVLRHIFTEKTYNFSNILNKEFRESIKNESRNFERSEKFYLRPEFKKLHNDFFKFHYTFHKNCLFLEFTKRKNEYYTMMEIYKTTNNNFVISLDRTENDITQRHIKIKGLDNLRNHLTFLCYLPFKK